MHISRDGFPPREQQTMMANDEPSLFLCGKASRAGTHWRIVLWYVFFTILNSSSMLLHALNTEVSSNPIWRRHAPKVAISHQFLFPRRNWRQTSGGGLSRQF